jgi:hypothetical protein
MRTVALRTGVALVMLAVSWGAAIGSDVSRSGFLVAEDHPAAKPPEVAVTNTQRGRPWQIVWLEAERDLSPWKARILAGIRKTEGAAAAVVPLVPLDIVVEAVPGGNTIPEIGLVGHAPRKGVIFLTVDPANPNFESHLDEEVPEHIAHELHHTLRWRAIGYGKTLGEVLVSEGLADHFAVELFIGTRNLSEHALSNYQLQAVIAKAKPELDKAGYNHFAWFYGTNQAAVPRWAGYTLGFRIVEAYLARHPTARPSGLASTPAKEILREIPPFCTRSS